MHAAFWQSRPHSARAAGSREAVHPCEMIGARIESMRRPNTCCSLHDQQFHLGALLVLLAYLIFRRQAREGASAGRYQKRVLAELQSLLVGVD